MCGYTIEILEIVMINIITTTIGKLIKLYNQPHRTVGINYGAQES